jgi:hypothetical protein
MKKSSVLGDGAFRVFYKSTIKPEVKRQFRSSIGFQVVKSITHYIPTFISNSILTITKKQVIISILSKLGVEKIIITIILLAL